MSLSKRTKVILSDEKEEKIDDFRFFSSYHGVQRNERLKPVRYFKNWTKYFKIPYFCLIDIAVFALYIIFAIFRQNSSISFSIDFENTIHSYLMDDLSMSDENLLRKRRTNSAFLSNSKKKLKYDFKKKIKSQFNNDEVKNSGSDSLKMIEPTVGIPFGEGQIFLINDFLFILDQTTSKLFRFSTQFPMSHPIQSPGYAIMQIILLNGSSIQHIIEIDDENRNKKIKDENESLNHQSEFSGTNKKANFERSRLNDLSESGFASKRETNEEFTEKTFLNNKIKIKARSKETKQAKSKKSAKSTRAILKDPPSSYIIPYLMDFSRVSVSMVYHLQISGRLFDSRINLEIISDFQKDLRTDTLIFDIYHNRFQEKAPSMLKADIILYTLEYSLPLVIIVLNIIAIIRLFKSSIYDLCIYSKRKSEEVGHNYRFIFSKKFDKWTLFAICTHFISAISMTLNIIIGQDIEQKVPPINIFLSVSSFMHSILLIRYLNLKDSTFLIITVLYKSSLILIQFLLGCLPFFFAFWAFGICFFGHLSFMFASPLQCASYMFCIMHGDSILALFDNTIVQNDYDYYLGFLYSSFWLSFSLLLMFNVTISILQDVLRKENMKLNKNEVPEDEQTPKSTLHLDFFTNNIPMMMNNNQYQNPNAFQNDSFT